MDFYDTHVNDIWLFQNKNLDHFKLSLTPSFDKTNVGDSSLQDFEYPLQCFPTTFAQIISVLPEKFEKFLQLEGGGTAAPLSPRLVRLCSLCSQEPVNILVGKCFVKVEKRPSESSTSARQCTNIVPFAYQSYK